MQGEAEMTICARFLTYQFASILSEYQTVASLGEMQVLYSRWVYGKILGGNSNWIGSVLQHFPVWDLTEWNHVCVSLSSDEGTMVTVLNGRTVHRRTDYHYQAPHTRTEVNISILGRQTEDGDSSPMFGRMTDVNIWSRSFTEQESLAWTECEMREGGDLVDWSTAKWELVGLEEVQEEWKEVCRRREGARFVLSDVRRDFDDTVHFCSVLGGEMAVAIDNKTRHEMLKVFSKIDSDCGVNSSQDSLTRRMKECL